MAEGAGFPTGTPMSDPALVEMISEDPILRNTKLIAEAWDCDGLNQVGAFPHFGGRWAEWNGQFRDAVRMFIKVTFEKEFRQSPITRAAEKSSHPLWLQGTEGAWARKFAAALQGSLDVFASEAEEEDWWGSRDGRKWRGSRLPKHSVNFITAHDGFSMADLVAFNEKHNDANGEGNRCLVIQLAIQRLAPCERCSGCRLSCASWRTEA